MKRLVALLVAVCLVGSSALGEEAANTASDSPVYRSVFTLRPSVDASAYPLEQQAAMEAWQSYIAKLSLQGTVDTQDFLQTFSRVYFDGALCLNDKASLPFEYDGYYSFRYVRSPALGGASVHFQMYNFFEFMMKPYYFLELPTNRIAPLLFPEATYTLATRYFEPLSQVLGGTETRTIESAELYELAETLDRISIEDEDENNALYTYLTVLLTDFDMSDSAFYALQDWESWLDFIDPEQAGMTVTVDGGTQTYTLGGQTLLTTTHQGDALTALSLHLPSAEGYALGAELVNENGTWSLAIRTELEEEERIRLTLAIDGLPQNGATACEGTASFTVEGVAAEELGLSMSERFTYLFSRDDVGFPCNVRFQLSWLHPETQKAAITLHYEAAMSEHDRTLLKDRPYDDQNDFFHLNEGDIEEYKQRFTAPLMLALVPFVLEAPARVINDLMSWLSESGFLGMLGLE